MERQIGRCRERHIKKERNKYPKIERKLIVDVGGFLTFGFVTCLMSLIWTKTGGKYKVFKLEGSRTHFLGLRPTLSSGYFYPTLV